MGLYCYDFPNPLRFQLMTKDSAPIVLVLNSVAVRTILQDAMKMLALVDRCCDVTGYQIRPGLVSTPCRPVCIPACLVVGCRAV